MDRRFQPRRFAMVGGLTALRYFALTHPAVTAQRPARLASVTRTASRTRGAIALPRVRAELWWLLPLIAAAMFYFWTATSSGNGTPLADQGTDYYNLLVDGFERGHLYLPVKPRRRCWPSRIRTTQWRTRRTDYTTRRSTTAATTSLRPGPGRRGVPALAPTAARRGHAGNLAAAALRLTRAAV